MAKRQRPETLVQTLIVGRPPSAALLSRAMQRFAGPWMLSRVNWEVVYGRRFRYKVELTWRSDVGQWTQFWTATEEGLVGRKRVKLYDDISRLDRLRLWLLVVESGLRHLVGRV